MLSLIPREWAESFPFDNEFGGGAVGWYLNRNHFIRLDYLFLLGRFQGPQSIR